MGKKALKKLARAGLGFTGTGAALGVGSVVLNRSEFGTAGANARAGIANLSTAMPVSGTIMGAGATLSALESLKKKRGRR